MKAPNQNRLLFLAALALAGATGCSSKAQAPVSTEILPDEVGNPGCLSLEKLLARLRAFPDDTRARIQTRDLKVEAPENARPPFLALLARGGFKLEEGGLNHLTRYDLGIPFERASQPKCESVSLYDGESNAQAYVVTGASATRIALERASDKSKVSVELLDPNTLRLSYGYAGIDVCANELRASVETTQVLTWAKPGTELEPEAEVSRGMLRLVAQSATAVPEGIQGVLSASDSTEEVKVPVADLKGLRDSEVRVEALACFPPPPPREDDQ